MLLPIIIPVYNVEQFVEKCIRSCESQDVAKDRYEIIVVNDGAKDNSLEVVQRVAAEYDNIRVFSQPNAGLSAARNMGMRLAKGEYYMFVDSDDWSEREMGEFLGNTPTNITTTKSAVPSMHWSTAKKIGVQRKLGSEKNLP